MRTHHAVWLLLVVACRDSADVRPSLITRDQIIAVTSEPAEVAPGQAIRYDVLTVSDVGRFEPQGLTLSYCQTLKALGDNRVASDACALAVERDVPLERMPSDACTRFGPSVPVGIRPPEPDATGGYYQPLRVAFDDVWSVALLRVRCALVNVPVMLSQEFRERYLPNNNPQLTSLTIQQDGEPRAFEDLPRDRELSLSIGWTETSPEPYVVYDSEAVTLTERTETLRASWFVTDGELRYDSTGSTGHLQTSNHWRTPDFAAHVYLWVVLRDDRNGTSYASYELDVR